MNGDPHPGPAADPPPDAVGPVSGEPSSDDRNLAMLAHLLGIFTGFLGALVIWLVRKDASEFVDDQGREALNFQITVLIAQAIAGVSVMVMVGCVLLPAVIVADIVFCIMAAVAASRGERYRYPLCLRLIS